MSKLTETQVSIYNKKDATSCTYISSMPCQKFDQCVPVVHNLQAADNDVKIGRES
jgi:sulfopyruvate decarboxylase TPP-binding subunit